MPVWFQHPSSIGTPDITPAEERILRAAADLGGVVYNSGSPRRDRNHARMFERMAANHIVVFTNAEAGGWERGMWAAHLTVIGWNVLFRWHAADVDGDLRDRHVGSVDIYGFHRRPCQGFWNLDGTCDCGAVRPLDAIAYDVYLANISDEAREQELNAPRLWCAEHGRMRHRDVTTKKVCILPGSDFHHGELDRI